MSAQHSDNNDPASEPLPRIFESLGPALISTLHEGDYQRAQGLIMGGVELNKTRDLASGDPALHMAVRKSACGVVKMMISHGVDVNAVSRSDEGTALAVAAGLGNAVVVTQLLHAGADPDMVGVDGETALTKAACGGHLRVIEKLLTGGKGKDVKGVETEGKKATVDVVERKGKNEFEKLEDLAKKEGRLELEVPEHCRGRSGLKAASSSHRSQSPPAQRSPRGATTIRSGVFWKEVASGNLVVKRHRRPPQSPLLKAVRRNAKLDVIRKLLEAGCAADRFDEKMNSPLHVAAHFGNANVSRMLLNSSGKIGSSKSVQIVNARNHMERTPLHFAARSGHPRILKMLLEWKAEINAMDVFGQTPLSVACDSFVRKLLEDKGGVVNYEAEEMLKHLDNFEQGGDNFSAPNSPGRSRSPSPGKRSVSPERERGDHVSSSISGNVNVLGKAAASNNLPRGKTA